MSSILIERSVPFTFTRAADDGTNGDGLTLDGYAAIWNSPTLINSWEGCFNEQIQQGAFRKTLRENTPVMQFDHGHHPLIGSIPIGVYSLTEEDDRGVHVVGRMADNWLMQPVRDAIANGSIDGMSFRFEVMRESWVDADGNPIKDLDTLQQLIWGEGENQSGPPMRTIQEVRCPEMGPVVWPAYSDTSVGVRARSVASEIRGDGSLRLALLAGLRTSGSAPDSRKFVTQGLSAKDVALALLFGDTVRDASPAHSAPPVEAPAAEDEVRDAPPAGHPSEPQDVDAPLPDEHPSQQNSTIDAARIHRDANYMRDYLAIITKGSERYDH